MALPLHPARSGFCRSLVESRLLPPGSPAITSVTLEYSWKPIESIHPLFYKHALAPLPERQALGQHDYQVPHWEACLEKAILYSKV